jgi:hypothetical protein
MIIPRAKEKCQEIGRSKLAFCRHRNDLPGKLFILQLLNLKGFDKASVFFYIKRFGGYITVRVTEGRLTSALLVRSHPFDVGGDRFAGGATAPII